MVLASVAPPGIWSPRTCVAAQLPTRGASLGPSTGAEAALSVATATVSRPGGAAKGFGQGGPSQAVDWSCNASHRTFFEPWHVAHHRATVDRERQLAPVEPGGLGPCV